MEFAARVTEVAQALGARLETSERSCTFQVPLEDGRFQQVNLSWNGEVVRCRTQCSSLLIDTSDLNLYRYLLRKNHELLFAAFALDPKGSVELVWTQAAEACTSDQLRLAIENLAKVGDFMEQKFSGPDLDRF